MKVEAWTPEARLRKQDAPVVRELPARSDMKIADFDPKAEIRKQIQRR